MEAPRIRTKKRGRTLGMAVDKRAEEVKGFFFFLDMERASFSDSSWTLEGWEVVGGVDSILRGFILPSVLAFLDFFPQRSGQRFEKAFWSGVGCLGEYGGNKRRAFCC